MISLRPLAPLSLALILTLLTLANAKCCIPVGDTRRCADGSVVVGYCCGHGSCNLFCCNCSGGCRDGKSMARGIDTDSDSAVSSLSQSPSQYAVCTASTGASIFSGDEDCGAQLFHTLDTEGVGKISLAQYSDWRAGNRGVTGMNTDADEEFMLETAEYFYRFDADGDGFVSKQEIHRAVDG